MRCPKCEDENHQNRDGYTGSGSQRYRCRKCGARYTPQRKQQGYGEEFRFKAIRMYMDGLSFRQIGRQLDISHATVMNWVKAHVDQLAETPMPDKVDTVEMDELYTFIGDKKTGSTS